MQNTTKKVKEKLVKKYEQWHEVIALMLIIFCSLMDAA